MVASFGAGSYREKNGDIMAGVIEIESCPRNALISIQKQKRYKNHTPTKLMINYVLHKEYAIIKH